MSKENEFLELFEGDIRIAEHLDSAFELTATVPGEEVLVYFPVMYRLVVMTRSFCGHVGKVGNSGLDASLVAASRHDIKIGDVDISAAKLLETVQESRESIPRVLEPGLWAFVIESKGAESISMKLLTRIQHSKEDVEKSIAEVEKMKARARAQNKPTGPAQTLPDGQPIPAQLAAGMDDLVSAGKEQG